MHRDLLSRHEYQFRLGVPVVPGRLAWTQVDHQAKDQMTLTSRNLLPQARIQCLSQPIPKQAKSQHHQHDGDAREDGQPGSGL